MKFEFDCEIKMLDGKIKWSVFYFPYSASEVFGSKGNIPVVITVDGHCFDHTLLASKNGHYMVYNAFIKQAVNKNLGDTLHVTLEKDNRKRLFVTPDYLKTVLIEKNVYDNFEKQPDYLKREQVNYIEIAKQEETKKNRIEKLILSLSE